LNASIEHCAAISQNAATGLSPKSFQKERLYTMAFPFAVVATFAVSVALVWAGRRWPIRAVALGVAVACWPLFFWIFHHEVVMPPPRSIASAGRIEEGSEYRDRFRMDLGRGSYVILAHCELSPGRDGVSCEFGFRAELMGSGFTDEQKNRSVTLRPGPNAVEIGRFHIARSRDEHRLDFAIPFQEGLAEVPVRLVVEPQPGNGRP
jgi:hypothetical protein